MAKIIKLNESDLNRLVARVIKEQAATAAVKPAGGGQYGPYCKTGQSQGILKQHTVGTGGPNVSMGETGLGLFEPNGKLICKISTKYTQGGNVATPTQSKPAQPVQKAATQTTPTSAVKAGSATPGYGMGR